jgi:DNA-binding response OmpR family regulator
LPATQTVLIVDRSEETQEVLRTVLERRGLRIYSASRAGRGLELARRHHPDLIVLDLEVEDIQPEEISASFARQAGEGETALVMLGSIRRSGSELPGGQIIAKPYHYGPLIRKIEAVLEHSRPRVA